MAEKLIGLEKKGGGKLKETVLWSNASPTSPISTGTSFSLSQNYTDFDYIKIVYRYSTTDSTENTVFYTAQDFDVAIASTNSNRPCIHCYSSTNYARGLYRDANVYNKLKITDARQMGGTQSSTTLLIPTQIIGLKY